MLLNLLLSLNLLWILPNTGTIDLQEALDKKMVQATVTSNIGGTHYQDPVIIHIKNITGSPISLRIENGRTFLPEDSTYQPIVVTKSFVADIAPGNTKDLKLSGMCFNAHKAAPHNEIKYKIGKLATGNLAKIVKFLQEHNYSGYSAQHAIWAISNNSPLEDVMDWDDNQANEIVKYLAEITGKKIPPPPDPNDYTRNLYVAPNPKVTIGGSFEFTLLKNTEIHIGMFDANGIVVRELYYNGAEKPGAHTFNYEFDASVFTDDVYYIRYLEDNVIYMESKLTK